MAIGNLLMSSPDFPPPHTGRAPFSAPGVPSGCNSQPDSYPSPRGIPAPCSGSYPPQTTMVRLTSCHLPSPARLRWQALKRSLIPILLAISGREALRPLPYTGRSCPCFESQLPHGSVRYSILTGERGDTSPIRFLQTFCCRRMCCLRCCIASPDG